MTTRRLYYDDCYLRDFTANVVEIGDDQRRVYLDRTAFYPTSGGQPFDTGTLGGALAVVDVIDEGDRIAHVLSAPYSDPVPSEVHGQIDWTRRFDFMQQHTGQHLLSAVLEEQFQIPTLSFHMGAELSTIEIGAALLADSQIESVEMRCAEIIAEARAVTISYEDAGAELALRKASERSGTLRIITIGGGISAIDQMDKSACGGTHVRSTAEIGPLFIRKAEKIRDNLRIEFVCGLRAVRRARADFETLADIARHLSAPLEKTPALVAAQLERVKSLEKTNLRLAIELAQREGRELWAATPPDADGIRRMTHTGRIDDAVRTRAQAFTAQGKAVFVAVSQNPTAVLLAASSDSGIHAGERVKAAVTSVGGRGGGNQMLAQGSVPAEISPEALLRLFR